MTEKHGISPLLTRLLRATAAALLAATMVVAQSPATQSPQSTKEAEKTQVPEAGGPQGDIGPIAVPKKKTPDEKPVEKPAPRIKNPEGLEDFSLRVNVPLVTVDATVLTKDGQFIPGLKKENFRILEDGVAQPIANFNQTEAPITAVLLVEFAANNSNFIYDMLNAAYTFTGSLKKEDYVAVISYDMKPQILVDFTQDKRAIQNALNTMRIPGFRETNMFDALYDTLDRIEGLEGRKYVVLVSTGRDTFSKLTYDKILAKVKSTENITIYAVGTGQALRLRVDDRMAAETRLDFLQADNQMSTFARMTGGKSYFPRFEGELNEIFADIAQTIRNQYSISFRPTNSKQDGTYRKIKVELVDDKGQPLRVQNQKGKAVKYQVIARDGYRAKQAVE